MVTEEEFLDVIVWGREDEKLVGIDPAEHRAHYTWLASVADLQIRHDRRLWLNEYNFAAVRQRVRSLSLYVANPDHLKRAFESLRAEGKLMLGKEPFAARRKRGVELILSLSQILIMPRPQLLALVREEGHEYEINRIIRNGGHFQEGDL